MTSVLGDSGEMNVDALYVPSSRNILVVEDSKFQRTTLARELSAWDYEVIEACDGVEGLDIYKERSPQLIITDLHMPRMDGFSLVEKIRESQLEYAYIIVISGIDDKQSIVKALQAGADDFLVKPFHPDELRVRLDAGERLLRMQSQDMLIFSLAQLADYRSKETGYHLERVQHYTRILAEQLAASGWDRLTKPLISLVCSMSCLHDIGKVAIPDYILNKPGRLTKFEYSIMKKHSAIGGQFLFDIYRKTGSEQLRVAHDIVKYHHERWDGKGYPDGLSGEGIPVAARIVALADVFDALSSRRCYKAAFDRDKCEAILKEERGRQFDPDVVDAYFARAEAFWGIVNKLQD